MNESRHCKINGGSFQVLGSLSTREQAVQYKYISSPGLTFNQLEQAVQYKYRLYVR